MEFRQVLKNELARLMEKDDKIVLLDADLSKPNGTAPLYKLYPDRCFQCGIAEANMMSVAAGLSAYGYKPVAVTFAPFATRRACDQIAVSCAYAKQNVKIIGTDPGITAELNGGTHMSFEDVAIMRSIPNMLIYDAVDYIQLQQAIEPLINHKGNVYIRMPRKVRPAVFDENYKFVLGKADVVREGTDISVIATGTMVYEALEAVNKLKEEGINAELISVNTIKPLDKDTLLKSINKTKKVLTCENNNVHGGLYSAVCELVCETNPVKVNFMGIDDEFGQVGKYDELLEAYHLTPKDIANKIKDILNK